MRDGWIDANLVVVQATGDPPEMAADVSGIMLEAQSGRITLHVHPVTVAEVVWVLTKRYGRDRNAVAATLRAFLRADGVRCEDSDLVVAALDDYQDHGVDFPDALLARRAAGSDAPLCHTFDTRHFAKLGVAVRRPGQA